MNYLVAEHMEYNMMQCNRYLLLVKLDLVKLDLTWLIQVRA